MSRTFTRDFLIEVAQGNIPGYAIEHKFGVTDTLGTSAVPVAVGNVYPTPTSAVSLEFLSSSSADALNGAGMHELTVVGLDASWNEQTVVTSAHATDGTTAVAISGTWLRVYRAYVSSSGAYATASGGSHVGTITIRVASGGATYATIPLIDSFPVSQTLIGAYTVPAGKTAYVLAFNFSADVSGTKTTDFLFFQRDNADDVTSSYSGVMRVQNAYQGTQNFNVIVHMTADSYAEKTDIGFMALASTGTTNKASAEFEMLIVDN